MKLSPEDSAFFRRRDVALSTSPLLSAVLNTVKAFNDEGTPTILAGSFGVDASERCFDLLNVAGYQLATSEKTDISKKQTAGTVCSDHLWLADITSIRKGFHQFTGRAGVIRTALTHPQIPDGWAWGGLVSSHCPVWAEFFIEPQPLDEATATILSRKNSERNS